jgi:DNA/RNA-binding domain of Phe-tRNA-synthetase-like protein
MEPAEAGGGATEVAPRRGRVAPRIAAELPGLALAWIEVEGPPRRSPEPVRRRLHGLADRFYGSHAMHMRERPIPWAYRVFFRHIGLDPDRTRTPVEELALRRLREGTFRSDGLPADALTIATVETGVALLALDAGSLGGPLEIRDAAPGEALGGRAGPLAPGTLVLADGRALVAVLFGPAAESHAVGPRSARIAIAAIQVAGVPDIAVEEALHLAAGAMAVA